MEFFVKIQNPRHEKGVLGMKWQIAKLLKTSTKTVEVDEMVDFSEAVKRNPDIRKMAPVSVTGLGKIEPTSRTATFDLTIKGEMVLGCALTLDDVNYPFEATINPVFIWDIDKYDEDSEDYLVKDSIELAAAVWQEIFIQIPLRVVKDDAHDALAAQGIELISEEEHAFQAQNKVDPRLEVLKNLKFED